MLQELDSPIPAAAKLADIGVIYGVIRVQLIMLCKTRAAPATRFFQRNFFSWLLRYQVGFFEALLFYSLFYLRISGLLPNKRYWKLKR